MRQNNDFKKIFPQSIAKFKKKTEFACIIEMILAFLKGKWCLLF